MELKYEVIKNQKFDIGRTINPFKCDCKDCDFLHCPKKNYAPKTRLVRPTVDKFIKCYSSELKEQKALTRELLDEFRDIFSFPKGTYWSFGTDSFWYSGGHIELNTFNRKYEVVLKGTVNVTSGEVWEHDFTTAQERLANRISSAIKKVNEFIEKERRNDATD